MPTATSAIPASNMYAGVEAIKWSLSTTTSSTLAWIATLLSDSKELSGS